MNFEEYSRRVESEVDSLSHKERIAVGLLCCYRLSSLYSEFSEAEQWGDEAVLRECRNMTEAWLGGEKAETQNLSDQLQKVIPDTEDFGTVLGAYALNAGVAHEYLLELMENNQASTLIYVLRSCYDTIDLYVHECLDPDCERDIPEDEIERSLAMIGEVKWQLDALKRVKGNQDILGFVRASCVRSILSLA